MSKGRVIIIDDDPVGLETLAEGLEEEGYKAFPAADAEQGLRILAEKADIDVVLTDLKMPKIDGIEVLRRVKGFDDALPVVLITAYASVETAIESMKLGAYDYVMKPIDLRRVSLVVEKAVANRALTKENTELRRRLVASGDQRQVRQLGGPPQ